jgi:hypothetical protein
MRVRKVINGLIGGQPLSKSLFYTSWKDGGLGLKSMVDRADACKLNQIVQLYGGKLYGYIEWRIIEEGRERGFKVGVNSDFMGWIDYFGRLGQVRTVSRNSPWNNAYLAAMRLDVKLNHYEDAGKGLFVLEDKHGVEELVEVRDKSRFLNTIGCWLKARYFKELVSQKSRGASFGLLKESPVSNFFLGNCKAPMSDYWVRFVLKGRNDTLWTPLKRAQCYKEEYENRFCKCSTSDKKVVESLAHILNSCLVFRGTLMTRRHDLLVDRVFDAVHSRFGHARENCWFNQNLNTLERECNDDMRYFKRTGWKDSISSLRPDMMFWKVDNEHGVETRTLWLVEVTVPFGRWSEEENSLDKKWLEKSRKYAPLLKGIKKVMKEKDQDGNVLKVDLAIIIVSSLGACYKGTRRDFNRMMVKDSTRIGKTQLDLWMKRLVTDAIRGSFNLWMNARPTLIENLNPKVKFEDLEREDDELGIVCGEVERNNNLHEVILEGLRGNDRYLDDVEEDQADFDRLGELRQTDVEDEVLVINDIMDDAEEPKEEMVRAVFEAVRANDRNGGRDDSQDEEMFAIEGDPMILEPDWNGEGKSNEDTIRAALKKFDESVGIDINTNSPESEQDKK